jgi:hypothetical protein
MLFKVRNKKTGIVRNVTRQAYMALGPKVYEKIGEVNDDGSERSLAAKSEGQQLPNRKLQVQNAGAAPVHVNAPKLDPNPLDKVQPDKPLYDPDEDEPTPQDEPTPEPKPERKKPGRKPKSISSQNAEEK